MQNTILLSQLWLLNFELISLVSISHKFMWTAETLFKSMEVV